MTSPFKFLLILFTWLILAINGAAQVDDICRETGATPSFDSPFAHVPYVYGKIVLQGFDATPKLPRVTVIFVEGGLSPVRWTVGKSNNYCFRRMSTGGTVTVEIDGVEAARRGLPSFGAAQVREDFEIFATKAQGPGPPGTISAKFSHPTNPQTVELYKKAADALASRNNDSAIGYLKQIVAADAADFIAWAKLGSLYLDQKQLPEAEAALRKSLESKVEYLPAWIHVGQLRIAQKRYDAAIVTLQHAASLDMSSARSFQLLGEAYLLNKQGTLGAQALNEAIRLDPAGMAECHLQLAHLYELAGAKHLAAREYKLFLTKVPNHPEKKKFEKYVKDNPEQPAKN